jgi:two-component system, sensor histidine kinase and response regulator
MSDLQILVVEDDPDGADMVMRMLDSANIGTTVAASGEAALSHMKANGSSFGAVVVDLALPEMDGFELLRAIRKNSSWGNIPLIAVTAYHTPELKFKALDAGFNAYFPKPLDTAIFLQALERVVGK